MTQLQANTFPKYPKMKHSGIDWIGEVPEHWEVRRVRYIFDEIQTGTTPSTNVEAYYNDEIDWFTPKDFHHDILFDSERKVSNFAIERKQIKLFSKNSIVVIGIGATSGKVAFLAHEATFNQQVTGFFTATFCNKYFFYLMRSQTATMLALANFTTLPILNNEFFKELRFPLPPLPEQTAIANFLDTKLALIDKAIAQKQRMIELLQERKQILIQQAVTRGLDPNAKLKDSGVDWIGMVPEGWEVKRLKYVARVTYGISPNEKSYNANGVGFILVNGPAEYSDSEFGLTQEIKWTTEPTKFASKGDLLFCLRGSTTGRLNICHSDLVIGRGCAAIRAFGDHTFLIYVIIALKDLIQDSFKGSTFPSVTSNDLDNYMLPLPPLPEQTSIAHFLDTKMLLFDRAKAQKQQEIEALKAYKNTLINSAVTGKIKVI